MSEIYYNGTILTMDEACPEVEALLVKNGKIVKRGTKDEIFARKEKDTILHDLEGKTMLPGFIDGHSHFAGLANSLSQCDLSVAKDFGDMVRLMRTFIEENKIPKGAWVSGTNYDHNFLAEKEHPDKTVLDEISTEHPIVVIHASSHMGVANSAALHVQKLTKETKDPEGGRYGRTPLGELNGYMEENAFVQFRNAMPMPDLETLMKLFKRAQEIYASYGITTVQEGMVTAPLMGLLQYARKSHVLYLDLAAYLDLENCGEISEEQKEYLNRYQGHLKIGGFKIFLDGSPQGRTAWMKEPYEGAEDGYRGYPIKTDEQLYSLILKALEKRQQLLAHCNGDAAAEQYITQFEKVKKDHPELDTHRPVMIHAQLVQEEQLERMAAISMIPSFFAAHTYYWGDIHIQNFGMKRAGKISPAGSAWRLGLPFTFHQDSPVLMPDVLKTVWCAAKRVTKTGVSLDQQECISVREGLKAVTVNAAYQYGEEKTKGTIEEGKLADLVILERNPLTVPLDEIQEIKVLETIKEGERVYHYRESLDK